MNYEFGYLPGKTESGWKSYNGMFEPIRRLIIEPASSFLLSIAKAIRSLQKSIVHR